MEKKKTSSARWAKEVFFVGFWVRKDLLGLEELTPEEINLVLETAVPMKEILQRKIKKVPTLRGRVVATCFYEPSTRTRVSFELAAKYLGADCLSLAAAASSVVKGESLKDTAQTLAATGVEVIILRHPAAGAPHYLARALETTTIINAGDGMHEHPTQGLLDLFTLKEQKGEIAGLEVAIVGDITHSRVARSALWGLKKLGAKVRVAGPFTLLPVEIERLGVEVCPTVEEALKEADAVIVLRLQRERQAGGLLPSLKEYTRFFCLTPERLRLARESVFVLHPGPVNRGVEIAPEVMEKPQSLINTQVTNGVAVRMALLYLFLGGGKPRATFV